MTASQVGRVTPAVGHERERILVRCDSAPARWFGAVIVGGIVGSLIVLAAGRIQYVDWPPGRLGWSLALLAAAAFIARGVFLGRPVTAGHASVAAMVLAAGLVAHLASLRLLGEVLICGSGLALMWPTSARTQPGALARVWALVDATHNDPLAPFAMQTLKSYHFSTDGTAALAYRTRLGFAVASGDPIGDCRVFDELVADFVRMCRGRGWRIMVLGCGERHLGLWGDHALSAAALRVPIGRDVVIDVQKFSMAGRRFRNLRQAVQRTRNTGISTEVVDEQKLDARLRAELAEVLVASRGGARTERGFSMGLDGTLERRYPGVQLIIARDRAGRVQGFQRYATAGHGSDVTLDAPFRRPGAPNGIDERLSIDMIGAAKANHAERLSLSFAAFPEIFGNSDRRPPQRVGYWLIHVLDPLIRLESLYRYLRKFHSLDQRRYAVVSAHHIPAALVVLLSLEFGPRHRHLELSPCPVV
jgi:lysylphosphatidylglycerol synthetase-like protein (DUF2156 family)